MKIAFCFLTYGDIYQIDLWRTFLAQDAGCYNIYIHNKTALAAKDFRNYGIPETVPTRYGHISLVKATLQLLQEASSESQNTHFVLLSDSCIPLYPLAYICQQIAATEQSWLFSYPDNGSRFKFLKDQSYFTRAQFLKQSQWMVIHRKDISFLLENDVTDTVFGERIFAPDEHYFISLFRHFDLPYINRSLTAVDWTKPVVTKTPYHYSPRIYEELDAKDIAAARQHGNLFMRKISKDCEISASLREQLGIP